MTHRFSLIAFAALVACSTPEGGLSDVIGGPSFDAPLEPGPPAGFPEYGGLVLTDRTPPAPQPPVPPGTTNPGTTAPSTLYRTGATPLALAADGASYVVDTDAGTVVRRLAGVEQVIDVGDGPTSLVIVGNRLLVTLRGERSVAVLDLSAPDVPPTYVPVGAEPTAIVATFDGSRAYVACSENDQVFELDLATLAVLARIPYEEPRFLAITPDATQLYVASARGAARLSKVNLSDLTQTLVPMPATTRNGMGFNPMTGEAVTPTALTPRISGDLSVSLDGARLFVPVLFADTITPIADITDPADLAGGILPPEDEGGYGGGSGVGRLNPAIVEIDTITQVAQAHLVKVADPFGVPNGPGMSSLTASSYLSSVLELPNGRLLAAMEASGAVVLVEPGTVTFTLMGDEPGMNGFMAPAAAAITLNVGLNGLAIDPQGQALWSDGLTAVVEPADLPQLEVALDLAVMMSMNERPTPAGTFPRPTSLSEEVRLGRLLFFSAANPGMGSGGVSCSTCHVEGRNDGLTWTFEGGPRQTPSLAGIVSDTAPVTWGGSVGTVAMEADITTRGRMGGAGLTPPQLASIAAYVDWTPLPDTALQGVSNAAIARGQALFERADVGCISCHSGTRFTGNGTFTIRGSAANTPPLTGVAATSPYLRDGSAPTLRALLERSRDGGMGNTVSLTDAELDDLTLYLKSL